MMSRRVGFIGLGNMGGRMTRRLAGAGYEVLGYDPVAGKAEAAGAIPADSVAAVVTGSDCVLMSLPDSSVIEPVVLGPAGVLASCRRAPSLLTSGPLAAFGLASSLGYANQISNKVVDAIGDLAGGVRLYDQGPDDTKAGD
jgi:3-hydroxyisobutyrate dehydrogenase